MSGNDWQKKSFTVATSNGSSIKWPPCPEERDGIRCSLEWGHKGAHVFPVPEPDVAA